MVMAATSRAMRQQHRASVALGQLGIVGDVKVTGEHPLALASLRWPVIGAHSRPAAT
jgi:hypothetical protein